MQVNHSGFYLAVSQKFFDGVDVIAQLLEVLFKKAFFKF